MELEEYARIAAVEDDHWWYRSTRLICADLLAPWLSTGQRVLDAGCGPGGNGAWLAAHGQVVGLDLAAEGLRFLQAGGRPMIPVQGSIDRLPFPDATFDVVLEITVVTCVPDDASAVRELARVLRPGGAVLLVEPAFDSLRRAHDKTVHTIHRYRRAGLASLAEHAGLLVQRTKYAYSFLAPPAAMLGLIERIRDRAPSETGSDVDKRALDIVFAPLATAERRLFGRRSAPFGTSVAVVATKPA